LRRASENQFGVFGEMDIRAADEHQSATMPAASAEVKAEAAIAQAKPRSSSASKSARLMVRMLLFLSLTCCYAVIGTVEGDWNSR
jgi:hypothetical protein